jgi:hypothetical protein
VSELCAPEDLPVAVIAQAWRDAGFSFARSDEKNHLAKRHPISRADRAAAVHFLIRKHGDWAEARRLWCELAGLDAEKLRQAALRELGA